MTTPPMPGSDPQGEAGQAPTTAGATATSHDGGVDMHGLVAGKVVLVTGAARGQGRAHAVRLAEQGADVIAVDVCKDIPGLPYEGATPAELDETVALVEKHGRRIVARQVDVRDL